MQLKNEVPAISLHEPYASLIAAGVKIYETRDCPPPTHHVGHRIVIHAARRKPRRSDFDQLTFAAINAALGDSWLDAPPKLGMVVCTAVIEGAFRVCGVPGSTGIVPFDQMRIPPAADIAVADGAIGIQTDLFGNYAVGRWCWKLVDVHVLPDGGICRGNRGWWFWRQPGSTTSVATT